MSTATPTPRDSTTAKAPQLRGWVEIFRAGKHTDSKGREFTASTELLDQIIANHAKGAAPAVIGHPKETAPAYAWVGELRRDGERLFCKFTDINPAFDDGVAMGAYRNRSVSLINTGDGTRLRHVGWLGAVPPAIDGLAPSAVDFASDDGTDVFDFASAEDAASALVWGLDRAGALLRGLRDWVIEKDGIEVADRVLPSWSLDSVTESATTARTALQGNSPAMFSNPSPGDELMPTTAEQLAAAQDLATKAQADLDKARTDFAAQGSELAELRAQRKAEKIDKVINDLKTQGKVLPAQEAGLREFMAQLDDTGAFEFSAADGKQSKPPSEWLAEFLGAQVPQIKLGRALPEGDPTSKVDMTDSAAILKAATDFQAAEAAKGSVISIELAVQHVTDENGVSA